MPMRWLIAAILVLHGLIHLMGFAKAFGLATLPQLTQPISRGLGVLWLVAALLVTLTAAMLAASAQGWWVVGALALVLSQAVIASAWRDAWAGTIANLILLLLVTYGWFTEGPRSLRAYFQREVALGLARSPHPGALTDADLARLPAPVQRYLRISGVVGQPRVVNYRVKFRGRIRSAPDARWMRFEAEQQSFADTPARLFLMHARMVGMPIEVFHRYLAGRATMQVKLAGAITMADARGDVLDRSETVTLFNDMCLLAPATLVDPAIQWEPINDHSAGAKFTNGVHTIAATLFFGDDGLLANFVSDDRSRASSDGTTFTPLRFLTPVRDYRNFGPARLPAFGEARWLLPDGEFTYGEFQILQVAYNVL
jgi:hypothetical protein